MMSYLSACFIVRLLGATRFISVVALPQQCESEDWARSVSMLQHQTVLAAKSVVDRTARLQQHDWSMPALTINTSVASLASSRVPSTHPLWINHHIWKAGGSMVCDMSIRNGEIVPLMTIESPDDRCTLTGGLQQIDSDAYTFAQIQRPMDADMWTGIKGRQIQTSVVLRDPLNQTLSHYKNAGSKMTLVEWIKFGLCRQRAGVNHAPICMDEYRKSLEGRDVPPDQAIEAIKEAHEMDYFKFFEDNIQVRWIAGAIDGTVFANPTQSDGVGEVEFNNAKLRLYDYNAVYILEQFNDRDGPRLASSLGWSTDLEFSPKVGSLRESNSEAECAAADIDYMRTVLRWDIALYEFAQNLAATQAQHAAHNG